MEKAGKSSNCSQEIPGNLYDEMLDISEVHRHENIDILYGVPANLSANTCEVMPVASVLMSW